MVKKLMLLACVVASLGLSNTAFAIEVELFRVDFSCPCDANTKAGGEWLDFEVRAGCDGAMHDSFVELEDVNNPGTGVYTQIDIWAGRTDGHSNIMARTGDPVTNNPICNSSLYFVPNTDEVGCHDVGLGLYDLDPYTSYRVYTYHAWDDSDDYTIDSITIEGADSNDIKVMPIVVETDSDATLLAHPNVGKIDFTTGGPELDGDGNEVDGFAENVTITFKGCTRFNAFALYLTDPKAWGPNPFNREPDVCPNDLQLSWNPVEDLVDRSHDVYFGTDYDDVADANRTNHPAGVLYSEDQDSNEYPEDGEPFLDLELETTYYWRVDTVNEGNVIPGGGYIWRFTTEDGNARYPCPYDYQVGWHPDANVLTWTPACVALSQEVYLSTSLSAVEGMEGSAYQGTLPEGANSIGVTLDTHTTYYWRVKSIGGGINGDGDVWCFGTGYGGVVMYYKFNGTVGNDLPSTISDDSGNNIQFTKYIGGNSSVKYGQSNPVVLGSSSSAEFNPDPNSGFYRIDTGFNDPLLLAGPQFTIEAWFNVDGDFDPGDDNMTLIGKSDGGAGDDWHSWRVELDVGSDVDVKWFHYGDEGGLEADGLLLDEWHHVALVYDQSLDQKRNKMYVNGALKKDGNNDNLNAPDDHNTVYIGMGDDYEDGEFDKYENFFAGMIDELRVLDIALTPCEFLFRPGEEYAGCPYPHHGQRNVDANVVLSWGPGSLATSHDVYIGTDWDDVNNATTSSHPNVDYNNIDVNHYPAEGNLVLESDQTYYWRVDERNGGVYKGTIWRFETTIPVFDPNLRVWYKLDEKSGDAVRDYSGRYYEGDVDIDGEGLPDWDPNDGRFGGSLGFNDNTDLACGGGVLDTIGPAISVSVWLKDAYRLGSDNPVFSSEPGDDPCFIQAAVVENSTQKVLWRVGGEDGNDVLRWNLGGVNPRLIEGWHHWVFIKDETENTMSIYFDSDLVASNSDVNDTLEYIRGQGMRLGIDEEGDKDFVGRIDDFRVYDKVLSDANIINLFRGGDPELAWGPEPRDGAAEVPIDTDLVWRPGDYVNDVNGHDLYFGTDWDEVNDANSTDHPNAEYHNLDVNTYDIPYLLELGQTYYWRVDQVNDSNVWTGKVWRFTVAEYITIDDMEDYTPGSSCAGYPITSLSCEEYGWEDGLTNQTGSLVDLVYPGSVHAGIEGHRSDQAMYYLYDSGLLGCGGYGTCYSEIWNHFELDPNDWTIGDVKMLSLWFLGDPLNDTGEEMYVGLEDTDTTYADVGYGDAEDEDVNDIKVAEWQRWSIPLSSFTSVNLESVEKLYIGFGTRNGDVEGGAGQVYFDNIRLYLATCVPSKRSAAFAELDLDGDCIIGFGDVGIMAQEWLMADVNLGQVSEPCDANLVGWWKFDEGSGSTASDSSTYNNNGTLETVDVNVYWVTDSHDGNALDFDGGRVRVPDSPELRPLHQVSAAAWIKYTEQQESARVVVKGADNKETYELEIENGDAVKVLVRDGNDPNAESYDKYEASSGDGSLDRDEWIHVAGTFDGNDLKCYVNGELKATTDANALVFLSQDTNDLAIGNMPEDEDKPFKGIIDDVQVYNYALSVEEVRYLATDGTGVLTMQSIANLSDDEAPGDRAVNFKDFAILADEWLEEEMYPQ